MIEKSKRLFAAQKTKRYYYDYYCDNNDNESTDDKYEDSGVEESDKDGTKTKPSPLKKQEKKAEGIIDYIDS